MNQKRSGCVLLFPFMLMGLSSGAKPVGAFAAPGASRVVQTAPIAPRQDTPEKSSFFDYLKQQSEKNSTLYLVEGEPAARPVPIKGIAQKDTAVESVALSDLAKRYGYRVETLPSGIVVLHKTYYDERDFPCVTLGEWLLAVKDMQAIINSVSPHITPPYGTEYPLADGILRTFSPEQFAAMARGQAEVEAWRNKSTRLNPQDAETNGLPVSRLSNTQKAEAARVAQYFYIQAPREGVEATFREDARLLTDAPPVFTFEEVSGTRLFGYTAKTASAENRFIGLSNPRQFTYTPQGQRSVLRLGDGYQTAPDNDPTKPLQKSSKPHPALASTLGALVKRLSQQNEALPAGKPIAVSQELADKRISIAGNITGVNPVTVLKAVVALYGLRVLNTDRQITLTRPRLKLPEDMTQTASALEAVLPLPFLNACRQTSAPDAPTAHKAALSDEASFETESISTGLRWAAIRRLRETIDPKINALPNKRVSLADCDAEEKEAFATILMSRSLSDLAKFATTPPPPYITHFDQTVLVGGIAEGREGRKWLSFFLGRRMPNGALAQGGNGFSTPLKTP